MEPKYVLILTMTAIMWGSITLIAFGWFWTKRPRIMPNKTLDEIAERLAALERAVDTIAVETERISEGQRFTTKLLSEKSAEQSVVR
jgi:uncharacterized protein YoxC